MPRRLQPSLVLAAGALGGFVVGAPGAQSFADNFDGPTPTTMVLDSNNALNSLPSNVVFTDTGDVLGINVTDADTGSASTTLTTDGDFRVSADITIADGPNGNIDFTAGFVAIFAYSGFAPGNTNGIEFRVENVGFTQDEYQATVFNNGDQVAQSAIFDLTGPTFDAAGTFNLELIGVAQPGGDLDVTATLTPDPSTTLAGSGPVVVTGTIAAAAYDQAPDGFGFRQSIFGGNDITAQWDNFSATTEFMAETPPPTSVKDTFDGGVTILTLEDTTTTTFTLANDVLNVTTASAGDAAASVALSGMDDFEVGVDVSPNGFDFTAGTIAVFAFGDTGPGLDDGIELRLTNDGFTADSYLLSLVNNGVQLGEAGPFDISAFSDNLSGFTLTLRGDVQSSGDVAVTGALTPDPGDNLVGLAPQFISAAIPAASFDTSGDLFGIRQFIFGGNPIDIDYDNFCAFDAEFVEPPVVYREVFPNNTGMALAISDPIQDTGWSYILEEAGTGAAVTGDGAEGLPILSPAPGLATGLSPIASNPASAELTNGFLNNTFDGVLLQQLITTDEFTIDRGVFEDAQLRWQQSGGSVLQAAVQIGGNFYVSVDTFPNTGPVQTSTIALDGTQWFQLFLQLGAFIFLDTTPVALPDGPVTAFGFYVASRTPAAGDNFQVDTFEVLGTTLLPPQDEVIYREIFEPDLTNDPAVETVDSVGWSVIGSDPGGEMPNLVVELSPFLTAIASGPSVPDVPAVNSLPLGIQTEFGDFFHFFSAGVWDLAQLISTSENPILATDFTPTGIQWQQFNESLVGGGVQFRGAVQVGTDWFVSVDLASNDAASTYQQRGVALQGTLWHPLTVEVGDADLMITGTFSVDFGTSVELPTGDLSAFGVYIDSKPNNFSIDTFEVLGLEVICVADFNDDDVINQQDLIDYDTALSSNDPAAEFVEPVGTADSFDNAEFYNLFSELCPGVAVGAP
ncbi:MAG: hypothetical protein AAGI30_12675 [Planctomycetota bacterium]